MPELVDGVVVLDVADDFGLVDKKHDLRAQSGGDQSSNVQQCVDEVGDCLKVCLRLEHRSVVRAERLPLEPLPGLRLLDAPEDERTEDLGLALLERRVAMLEHASRMDRLD